jgi:K+-transporting ATPase A subunit
MQKLKKASLLFLLTLCCQFAMAQVEPEMADVMRSNGKIFVVVAVLSVILIGLFIYLFILDRKIKRLENDK